MILIEHKGELQLVNSLDGYDGAKVIEDGIDLPPNEHSRRDKGKWVVDEKAKAKADRRAELNAMSKWELAEMFEARIAALEAKMGVMDVK